MHTINILLFKPHNKNITDIKPDLTNPYLSYLTDKESQDSHSGLTLKLILLIYFLALIFSNKHYHHNQIKCRLYVNLVHRLSLRDLWNPLSLGS